MPDANLVGDVMHAAQQLIEESVSGEIDGTDIARAIGRDPDDIQLYYVLRDADRRGDLECPAWRGGMALPAIVRLP